MQKKLTKKKVNKKAPQGRGASRGNIKNSIFNYELEIDDEKTLKKKEKRLEKQNKDFLDEDKFIGAKELPTINMKKVERKQKNNQNEDKFIGAKELPKINRKKVERENKNFKDEERYIGTKEVPQIDKKKLDKIKKKKRKQNAKRKKVIKKQEENEEKQRQLNKKRLNSKQIEHLRKVKRNIKIAFLMLLLLVAVALFMLSPIFNITEIKVNGNNKITTDEIISLSQIGNGTNLFKASKRKLKSNIKEEPYIKEVQIKRILPKAMEINVVERELEYLFEYGNSYVYIGSQGYILEISEENKDDKLKISGYSTSEEMLQPGNRICKEDIRSLNEVIQIMTSAKNNSLDSLIKKIDISDNSNYILYIDSENKKVNLGDISNLDTKMLYIQVILEKEKNREGTIFANVDLRNKYPYFSENVYK